MLASAGLHYGFVAVHYFHLLAFWSAPSSLVLIVLFGDGAPVSYLYVSRSTFHPTLPSSTLSMTSPQSMGRPFFEFHDLEGLRPRRTQWVLDVSDSGCMTHEEEENPRKAVSEGTFTEAEEASNSVS